MSNKLTLAAKAVRNLVVVNDGKPITSSRWVAEVFGREHKNILQAYDKLECSEEFRRLNFQPSSYLNGQNKEQRQVDMTFDGFTFLVMGFTGRDAAQFKEAYIAEFNRMRNKELEERNAYLENFARFPAEPLTDERRASVVQMLSEGYSIADAARLNRVSQKTVRILRDANLPAAVNKNQGRLDLEGGAA